VKAGDERASAEAMMTIGREACFAGFLALSFAAFGCSSGSLGKSAMDAGRSRGGNGGSQNGTGGQSGTGDGKSGSSGSDDADSGSAGTPDPVADAGPVEDGSACVAGEVCTSDHPDPGCSDLTLPSKPKVKMVPGNVLIIWDRSTSMTQDWNGMPKWQAAGEALIAALMPLADQLTIGAELFPASPDGMCTINPITAIDQVNFQPGPAALAALQAAGPGGNPTPLYGVLGLSAISQTPTSEAVQAADAALAGATLAGTTAVILVTDGEPNCAWDEAQTTATITSWLIQKNIQTYVFGLPGVSGNGPTLLNSLAQAGGTTQYLTPADSATLQMKIHDIVAQTIVMGSDTCSIDLTPPASTPDSVQLVVEEASMPGVEESVPHDLGAAGGWTISADGSRVELKGGVCDSAESGRFLKLSFKVGCKGIPPIPPSHACVMCGSDCVLAQSDPMNCGGCGNVCAGGSTCVSGQCQCPTAAQVYCGGTCIDTTTDSNNCGACGNVCPASKTACCAGVCRDTQTDRLHCGGCGKVCAATVSDHCAAGACMCETAAPCTAPQMCRLPFLGTTITCN
jgi:hypothetical protein